MEIIHIYDLNLNKLVPVNSKLFLLNDTTLKDLWDDSGMYVVDGRGGQGWYLSPQFWSNLYMEVRAKKCAIWHSFSFLGGWERDFWKVRPQIFSWKLLPCDSGKGTLSRRAWRTGHFSWNPNYLFITSVD